VNVLEKRLLRSTARYAVLPRMDLIRSLWRSEAPVGSAQGFRATEGHRSTLSHQGTQSQRTGQGVRATQSHLSAQDLRSMQDQSTQGFRALRAPERGSDRGSEREAKRSLEVRSVPTVVGAPRAPYGTNGAGGGSADEEAPRRALSIWLRLLKAHTLILREVRRDFGEAATLPQFEVLAQLQREPSGLTLVDLSRRLLVSAGNLTGIVARLERDGLVRREADPFDRRAFRVRLTPRGRSRVERLIPRHARLLSLLLADLSPRDQEELRSLLGRLGDGIALRDRIGTPGLLPGGRGGGRGSQQGGKG